MKRRRAPVGRSADAVSASKPSTSFHHVRRAISGGADAIARSSAGTMSAARRQRGLAFLGELVSEVDQLEEHRLVAQRLGEGGEALGQPRKLR